VGGFWETSLERTVPHRSRLAHQCGCKWSRQHHAKGKHKTWDRPEWSV